MWNPQLKPEVYVSGYQKQHLRFDIFDPHDGIDIDILTLSRILTPIDLEELFRKSPSAAIINQGHLVVKKLSEEFTQAIFAESDEDVPFVPSCSCGSMKGKVYEGMTCFACNTKVSTTFVDHLSHVAWLGIPEGMSKVLHPVWYFVLKEWVGGRRGESSIIDAILNPEQDLPKDLRPIIEKQGYTYFYENHKRIMEFLLYQYEPTRRKRNINWVRQFWNMYKDIMFTDKLPILHNSLHPLMSGSATLKYADRSCKEILQAVYDLSAITFSSYAGVKAKTLTPIAERDMNKTLFSIYEKVIEYYKIIISDKLGKKPAIIRKHNLGTRAHFSIRMVVVPITGAHSADEIHLPWKVVVNTYKLEIINRLVRKYKMSVPKAVSKHLYSLVQYDSTIHQILLDLMKECRYKGFPFLIGRNPTLRLYSILELFCATIKIDLTDETMSISPLVLKGSNTDFDGDELYGQNFKEQAMVVDYDTLHPREAVLDTNSPNVSTLVMPSNQALLNCHNFLYQNPDTEYEVIAA